MPQIPASERNLSASIRPSDAALRLYVDLPADRPVPPGREPAVVRCKRDRNRIDALFSEWAASRHSEKAHPAAGPETMPGDRLVGIFRASGLVAAGVADESGQRQLIEAHDRRAQKAAGRLGPRPAEIARASVTMRGVRASPWMALRLLLQTASPFNSRRIPRCGLDVALECSDPDGFDQNIGETVQTAASWTPCAASTPGEQYVRAHDLRRDAAHPSYRQGRFSQARPGTGRTSRGRDLT